MKTRKKWERWTEEEEEKHRHEVKGAQRERP